MTLLHELLSTCRAAAAAPDPQRAVAEALSALLLRGPELAALEVSGADERGVARVHVGDDVTVLHVDLAPGFRSRIHSHGTWAVVAVMEGREVNRLYRREGDGVREVAQKVVEAGEVFSMSPPTVHAIENPGRARLRAIHVYGGDLEAAVRHRWDILAGPPIPEGGAV